MTDVAATSDQTTTFSQVEMIDQALAPALRIAGGMGPVGHHELSAVVTSFRAALLAAVGYDHDNPPAVEAPRVETPATDKAAMAQATADAPANADVVLSRSGVPIDPAPPTGEPVITDVLGEPTPIYPDPVETVSEPG